MTFSPMGRPTWIMCGQRSAATGFNRAEMLKVQKEIDRIKKVSTSVAEHKRASSKALETQKKVEGVGIGHKVHNVELAIDFGKKDMPYQRKTEPNFTPDYLTKPVPVRKIEPGTVPPYNPLDKDQMLVPHTAASKRSPHHKEKTTTTQDMKKPRVQTIGVTPVRSTGAIRELNVGLQGKPVMPKQQTAITAIQQANVASSKRSSTITAASDLDKVSESTTMQQPTVETPVVPEATEGPPDLSRKPAILGQVGTIASVKFSARAKPTADVEIPKKKTKLKSKKSARKSKTPSTWDDSEYDARSYVSDEMDLSLSRPSGSPVRDRFGRSSSQLSKASSVTSQKSATELLEEAKDIVSQDSIPLHRRKSETHPSDRRLVRRMSRTKIDKLQPLPDEPKDRSVDDIIASLKAAREGKGFQSEADIKIQEIMRRVVSRSTDVLGEGAADSQQQEEIEETTQDEEKEESEPEEAPANEDELPDIMIESATEGTTSVLPTETTTPQDLTSKAPSRDEEVGKTPTGDSIGTPVAAEGVVSKPSVEFQEEVVIVGDDESEDLEEIDLEQAWQDLHAPIDVRYEEIMNIEGESQSLVSRQEYDPVSKQVSGKPTVQSSSVSFLSAWAPQELRKTEKVDGEEVKTRPSIHHFCTVPVEVALPNGLQQVSRMYHTPSKYGVLKGLLAPPQAGTSISSASSHSSLSNRASPKPPAEKQQSEEPILMDQHQRLRSAAARRILLEAEESETNIDDLETLATWERRAQEVFDEDTVEVVGQSVPIRQDVSHLYWNPAPPKMDLPSSYIQNTLFPEFHGTGVGLDNDRLTSAGDDTSDRDSVATAWDEGDLEDRLTRDRILARQYASSEDLTHFSQAKKNVSTAVPAAQPEESAPEGDGQEDEEIASLERGTESRISQTTSSVSESDAMSDDNASDFYQDILQKYSETATSRASGASSAKRVIIPDDDFFVNLLRKPLRRIKSMPSLGYDDDEEEVLILPTDFQTCMEELEKQKAQIHDAKEELLHPSMGEAVDIMEAEGMLITAGLSQKSSTPDVEIKRSSKPTLAEKAREAGLKYVVYPKSRGLEEIEAFLKEKPTRITRRVSFAVKKMPVDYELRVPRKVRAIRRNSLPSDLDFQEFLDKQEVEREEILNLREYVRGVWDDWFDIVFPPTQPASVMDTQSEISESQSKSVLSQPIVIFSPLGSATSSVLSEEIDNVEPLADTEENKLLIEELQDEVMRLSAIIDREDKPSPFDLTRRGAICRKLGKLKQAWDDLNQAIEMEPMLLDAYWHRHLLYLLRNKPANALQDLNAILKINKEHVGAYRSRAEIYREKDDITMAIVNYTQTIKLDPEDYDAFFKRAEMYEKRGEMLLALEDYREVTRLMPSKTEALFKRATYQFDVNKNWIQAIKDFTELVAQEPHNALARTYRGRACAKQGLYVNAVEDLSAAVHLDPYNSVAFFYRGCLLRKAHPKQALQDFSVSVLLNDSEDNVMAFFHRGILYMDLNRHEDAIADFENVLRLDKAIAGAHVNLGLIYMTKLDNYTKAIQKFGNAIKVDPTYVRALVCRGEAFHKIHDLKNALLDFTRAIHLRPDHQQYYMYRGEILLEMKNLELASFCVQHAAELSQGLGSSPTQQAAVQSFLQNYSKAIEILLSTAKVQPSAPLYILLGKTQIKAKKYREAVESLEKALDFMKPWQERQEWPKEAAEVYYLIGMCHMEIPNHLKAYEAFNDAIRINAHYPEAFYQRGLTRMKLRQAKGIVDFNRALALNPKLFQAYLSRAAYYGMRGRYSKAIVNCNEAIRLQPRSVRAYLYRGALKYYIQAYKLAIKDLCTALEIDNTCSLAYFNRAVCYHTTKDYRKALRDYGIVLMLGEENALKVLINRGLMYFAQKDYRNAKQDFSQAAKEDPRDPKIRHTLGLCCHKLNQLEDSVLVFTRALENNPFFLDAYISRGNAFMDYGHQLTNLLARRDYERALHLDPMCLPARVNLAYNMQVCGKHQQAWEQFTACLNINSNYHPALEGRAIVCLQMSDTFAAFLDLNKAIKLSASAELLTNRGVVNQFMQDHNNAMKDYQAAIKRDPTYALAYFNAANVYFHNRQFRQAHEYYSKTLDHNPRDESACLNRAITKVLMRDARGALEDFQQAIKLSPLSAHVYFNRGNLYTSLRRYELAEKDYSQALKLQPDDPLVHKRRAEVRGKLGRHQDAILDYKRAIEIQSKKHL
ncbi:uncharacterized protein [Amphiura filiformis]|uniref:uncharacterized protein n=1 Tax=Amphiura filiformis TaxID=82378 RepID=UPI003B225428